jgi:hypothetical protein
VGEQPGHHLDREDHEAEQERGPEGAVGRPLAVFVHD